MILLLKWPLLRQFLTDLDNFFRNSRYPSTHILVQFKIHKTEEKKPKIEEEKKRLPPFRPRVKNNYYYGKPNISNA